MAKNIMSEVLKMLGVEYGEKFKLQAQDLKVADDDLYCFDVDNGLIRFYRDGSNCMVNEMLYDIMSGYYEIIKLPIAENYMADVAQILGLKLCERFKVYDPNYGAVQSWCEYMLTKDGVVQCWINPSELPEKGATVVDLNCLIFGGFTVLKLSDNRKAVE